MTRTFQHYILLSALPALVLGMALAAALLPAGEACSQQQRKSQSQRGEVLVGQGALGDWTTDAPGVRRRITTADMPPPYATRSIDAGSKVVKRPEGAWPLVPAGFKIQERTRNQHKKHPSVDLIHVISWVVLLVLPMLKFFSSLLDLSQPLMNAGLFL